LIIKVIFCSHPILKLIWRWAGRRAWSGLARPPRSRRPRRSGGLSPTWHHYQKHKLDSWILLDNFLSQQPL